jgi:hypothetical protein
MAEVAGRRMKIPLLSTNSIVYVLNDILCSSIRSSDTACIMKSCDRTRWDFRVASSLEEALQRVFRRGEAPLCVAVHASMTMQPASAAPPQPCLAHSPHSFVSVPP